jgi:hypothetical protein
MTVRVDGEVAIPAHRWYQLIDLFTRIDEQLEVLIKLQDRTNRLLESLVTSLGGITPPPAGMPAVVQVEDVLNNRYKVYRLDLSIPRSNVPLGLRDIGVVARCATVTRMDSPAYWRRNDPSTGELEELSVGYHIDDFAIEELYITNNTGSGYLTVVVEWRE